MIYVPVLSCSWFFGMFSRDHSVIIKAVKEELIELEASAAGGVPRC